MSPAGLSTALAALLGRGRSDPAIWVTGAALEQTGLRRGTAVAEADLPKRLKAGAAPAVLWLAKITPTIVRALRSKPPALVVIGGSIAEDRMAELSSIDDMAVLGPNARVRIGDGDVVACAASADELDGLVRAIGSDRIRLALCPTPAWFFAWLSDRKLVASPVAGYVHAAVLRHAWLASVIDRDAPCVIVPLGVPTPTLAAPDEPAATTAVVAHTLERFTGPVFPSPRVVARVLAGLSAPPPATSNADVPPLSLAIWGQARRALPMTGAVVGMEAPIGPLPGDVPTASFLAQRAILRARHATALVASDAFARLDAIDDDGLHRAREVLANAGPVLTDHESKVVLRGFGMDVTRQAVASSASGAVGFADRIGYPVVLKALSPDLRRRSEIGAIAFALSAAASVRRAYTTIVDAMERHAPTARLDGVLVAEMVDAGLDVRAGAVRLPGGSFALFGQVADAPVPIEPVLAPSPLAPADAGLLAHAVLSRVPVPGLRRDRDPDIQDLARLLLRVDAVVQAFADRLTMIRLDPVRLCGRPRGGVVLDARIVQRPHLEGR